MAKGTPKPTLRAASRPMRRRHLAALGQTLGALVATVDTTKRASPPASARTYLERVLRSEGARKLELCAFGVRAPAAAKTKALSMRGAPPVQRVDVALGELPRRKAPFLRFVVVVARQTSAGMIVRRAYSR